MTGPVPGLVWGLPFLGLLVSVAVCPALAPRFWHRRMGLVAAGWTLALLLPMAVTHGALASASSVWDSLLLAYLPYVLLLLALFVVGGGILLEGGPWGSPAGNVLMLLIGTVLAGVMGTTGVSMVLIHPLLRANAHRRRRVHLVVFFTLLCANAGGATTPLGDPPLYLGFLQGVPLDWPLRNLSLPLGMLALPLLAVFWLLDRYLAAGEPERRPPRRLRLRGGVNLLLVVGVVAVVVLQGLWHPGHARLLGASIATERLVGMALLLAMTACSLLVTPKAVRQGNLFHWAPIIEVAKLFAAIFVTMAPVLAMLAAGRTGPLAPLLALTADRRGQPDPLMYFWLCGLLSAFLDNAPTYLVFFRLAGDDPARLTGALNPVLTAIGAGAVFFGGLTYVGNAPNLMLRSIAAHRGIRMPGFFGYMAWSAVLMLPLLAVISVLLFR